ncbi:MAG: bL21 family ribosomal protein [Ignavibacteria bacterium]
MFTADDKSFEIGAPVLSKTVEATVLNHVKDDTVIVFKKKEEKVTKSETDTDKIILQIEINRSSNYR